MPQFTVTGDVDPFLHVSLRKGEKIYCESDAMVMIGNLVNSVTSGTSGEGIVLRFKGSGKVHVCSRNRDAFVAWLKKDMAGASR